MAQTMVSFRMDEGLKKNMEQLCDELGMTMTTAFTIFAKKMTREKGIPFEVSVESPNAATRAAIEEVQQMKANPSIGKSYTSVGDMMEDLLDEL